MALYGTGITVFELALFTRKLVVMLNAGVPFSAAFASLAQSDNLDLQRVARQLTGDIQKGCSISTAFARHPQVFSSVYISVVRVGENSGHMEECLNRLADYLERSSTVRRKIISALTYPLVISIVSIALLVFFAVYFLPQTAMIFSSMGEKLPGITLAMLKITKTMSNPFFFLMMAALVGAGFFCYHIFKERREFKLWVDLFLLNAPVVKRIYLKYLMARVVYLLSVLLNSGVGISESFKILEDNVDNKILSQELSRSFEKIMKGQDISTSLSKSELFSPLVIGLIKVGEKTGELPHMLSKAADLYEEDLERILEQATVLVEPLIMFFLGGGVGFMCLAMFAPIIKMMQTF